jgi:hypothetical protein
MILSYVPFFRDEFAQIVKSMRMHRALAVILDNGAPTLTRIPTVFDGKEAYGTFHWLSRLAAIELDGLGAALLHILSWQDLDL